MSISDFKDLWNVQPAPRSCMRRDEATLETEVSDFDARGESRTDLIRVRAVRLRRVGCALDKRLA